MAESHRDYAKWKKPDADRFIRFHLHGKSGKDKVYRDRKQIGAYLGLG